MNNTYNCKLMHLDFPRILVSDEFADEFITRNKFTLNRTQDEILKFIKKKDDCFIIEVLYRYLDFDNAKQFLKDGYTIEQHEKEKITNIKEAVQDMLDYLIFGYGKALNERGLSASRTITKLNAWFFLLGRDDLSIIVTSEELYSPYGMPALIKVAEMMGLSVPQKCIDFCDFD